MRDMARERKEKMLIDSMSSCGVCMNCLFHGTGRRFGLIFQAFPVIDYRLLDSLI